jgi:hypothetical protein
MEIRGRELDGVEQDSSLFRVEPAVQQILADLRKRSLDRVRVVEAGQEERRGRELGGAAAILYQGAATIVKVTKLLIAKSGRAALRSVLFYVLARCDWISGHYDCSLGRGVALCSRRFENWWRGWKAPPPTVSGDRLESSG